MSKNKTIKDEVFITEWILRITEADSDNVMVDMVAHEMRLKMRAKRNSGRRGWYGPNCSQKELLVMLREHIDKGDMVDVLNFAGMILARQKLYGEEE